ncbi:MAG: sigma-54-dependent Fis family transcriptional regulator [Planctomycetota bacterium]|nr:MAG: sigma-54-dependent Fis family transcriptional regulator [Planctomycetota bacterium]
MAKVLIVDDERSLLELLEIVLSRSGHEVLTCDGAAAALKLFGDEKPDIVLLDLRLGTDDGLDVLARLRTQDPDVPVVVITAYSTWDNAVEAMRRGAYDFIKKPFDDNDLIREVVARALAQRAMLSRAERREAAAEILGNSPALRNVLDIVRRVAPTDTTVLVTGESGTGKELLARALHYCSSRSEGPYLSINCAAFPAPLLESELFGHVKGAFSGAHRDKKGLIEVCNRGTLFLDEVGEMNLETQVKLLRVLEDRRILPVGSTEPKTVDVRFICATNRDLEEAVADGRFRADLYYRINVLPVHLPPLRERRKDIPLLAAHFLVKYSRKLGKKVRSISPRVQARLEAHSWPGNVRELENTIQRAVTLARGEVIDDMSLIPSTSRARGAPDAFLPAEGIDLEQVLAETEMAYLEAALERTSGHLTNAAKLLNISFRAMRYKVKKYGLRSADD